jgi:hypothetical protein
MPVCSKCGAEHELLDPTFGRPDAYVALARDVAREHAKANDDLCRISLPGTPPRFFVRGTLPVEVATLPDGIHWGLWAEVSGRTFFRILELWSDDQQASEPAYKGRLANDVPSYPATIGLEVELQLTGPRTRPLFRFVGPTNHPFVAECRAGVTPHRAHEWSAVPRRR